MTTATIHRIFQDEEVLWSQGLAQKKWDGPWLAGHTLSYAQQLVCKTNHTAKHLDSGGGGLGVEVWSCQRGRWPK